MISRYKLRIAHIPLMLSFHTGTEVSEEAVELPIPLTPTTVDTIRLLMQQTRASFAAILFLLAQNALANCFTQTSVQPETYWEAHLQGEVLFSEA